MGKGADRRTKKATSGFRTASRRARMFLVVCVGGLLIAFVALPLWINGYLFVDDPPAPVLAAAPAATPEVTPLPTPEPTASPSPTPEITPTPEPTATPVPYQPLHPEDEHESVALLQARLMELGYFDYDETTNYYGPVTVSAVQLVQRVLGVEQTGVADSEFLAMIYGDEVPAYCMRQGDKGFDVQGMQARLTELGYYEEKINGYFGVATHRAVLRFQEKNKLEETGEIDTDARNLLYSPDAKPLIDPTPTPTVKPTPKPTPKPTDRPVATPRPSFNIPELDVDDDDDDDRELPDFGGDTATPTPKPTPTKTPKPSSNESYGSGVSGLIAAAQAQLGRPYVWSAESPEDGFDCSGLVYYCLRQAGVSVSRWNALNYSQNSSWQAITSLSDCQKGDLLFYKSDSNPNVNHTGIYLGGGQFIHASSSQGRVMISSCTGYYQRNFVVARRVF